MEMQFNCVGAESQELSGRIPYKMIFDKDGNLLFRWVYVGQKKFEEPFFGESISACLHLPQNSSMPYTTPETLIEKSKSTDVISPTAFIFHISRCGSTLLTQMLCMDERFIVLSEVELLDDVIRLPFSNRGSHFPVHELYCSVLRLLGEKRTGKEKYLFVKTDSWHLLFFETIRQLFPEVPALLLYRSPNEVIRSQQKLKGMHAVQGLLQAELFGFKQEKFVPLSPDEYLSFVLEQYLKKCIEILAADKKATGISYHDGAMPIMHSTVQACGISLSADVLAAMELRTKKHSKNPSAVFTTEEIIPETVPRTNLEELFLRLNAAL